MIIDVWTQHISPTPPGVNPPSQIGSETLQVFFG